MRYNPQEDVSDWPGHLGVNTTISELSKGKLASDLSIILFVFHSSVRYSKISLTAVSCLPPRLSRTTTKGSFSCLSSHSSASCNSKVYEKKKERYENIYRNNSRVDYKYKEPMLMLANRDHQHLLLKKVYFLRPACNIIMFPTRILVICRYQFIIKMRVKNENFLFQSIIHG